MFYLLKRIDENQCNIGDEVMVLADFVGVPAGTKGVVTEIYDGGLMVTWARLQGERMNQLNTIETIKERISHGDQFMACQGWRSDGFSRDELQYLRFKTDTLIG